MTCNECIHQKLCDMYADFGVTDVPKDDITPCELFMDKSALEKQIPKKPIPHKVDVEKIKIGNANWCKGTTIYYCPNCNDFISKSYTYCHKCGQALDWSDNNAR